MSEVGIGMAGMGMMAAQYQVISNINLVSHMAASPGFGIATPHRHPEQLPIGVVNLCRPRCYSARSRPVRSGGGGKFFYHIFPLIWPLFLCFGWRLRLRKWIFTFFLSITILNKWSEEIFVWLTKSRCLLTRFFFSLSVLYLISILFHHKKCFR